LHVSGEIDAEAVALLAALEFSEIGPRSSQSQVQVKSRRLN